jgi:protoporphyrinogen oxidase
MGFLQAHFAKDAPEPANFEQFCRLRFGDGISRHFMIPYNTRLWGVPPSDISAAWCARFVPLPKLEDVVAGAVGLNDRELGYNTRFSYPKLGIGELARGLARAAGPLELGRAPHAIDWRKRVAHVGTEAVAYHVLVSSVPLPVLVRLLVDPPAEVSAAAARLRCTHLWYLDVALDEPCGKDLHWVYVPEERFPFYRVGCYSNFSSAMAPPGKSGLYVELADRAQPELASLMPEVARGLCEMQLVSSPEAIRFVRARRIDHAYVIFDDHHDESVKTIRAFLEEQAILSTGRYGGWNYSSMEDALEFGREAAAEAARRT